MAYRPIPLFRAAFVAAVFALSIAFAWLCDDIFITFRAVENFTNGYGITFNIGERVLVFTHPLWFWLLTLGHMLGFSLFWWTFLLQIFISTLCAYLITRIFRDSSHETISIITAGIVIYTSYGILCYQTSGLENPLLHLFVILLFYFMVRREPEPRSVFIICSFLIFTRYDYAFLTLPIVLWAFLKTVKKTGLLKGFSQLPYYFSIPIAWIIFSIVYYGFPLPNTAYAKVSLFDMGSSIKQGLIYIASYAAFEPIHFVLYCILAVVVGFYIASGNASNGYRLLASGVLLQFIYVIMVGGDFMHARFLTPLIYILVLLSVWAMKDMNLLEALKRREAIAAYLAGITILCLLGLELHQRSLLSRIEPGHKNASGVLDERKAYRGLWLSEAFRETMKLLKVYNLDDIAACYQVGNKSGLLVFGAGVRCYSLPREMICKDVHAITSPFLAHLPRSYRIKASRVGHTTFPGFVYSQYRALAGLILDSDLKNKCLNPKEQALIPGIDERFVRRFEAIKTITTAPVFSKDRWRTMLDYWPGKYSLPERAHGAIDIPGIGRTRVWTDYPLLFGKLANITAPIDEHLCNMNGAVFLHPEGSLTMRFPEEALITGLEFQGGTSDGYIFEVSEDGKRWTIVWMVNMKGKGACPIVHTPEGFRCRANYLRVRMFGDINRYHYAYVAYVGVTGHTLSEP